MPSDDSNDEFWYPTVDDVLLVHEDVVAEDDDASPGVNDADRIEFAISYIKHGHFGEVPETIHQKAFHLMRLLASNHWFVDGNKRTALNTTELFYLVNGYELDYGEDLRSMLKLFSVRESLIDRDAGAEYFRDRSTRPSDDDETTLWSMLGVVIVAALANWPGEDLEEHLPEDHEMSSVRDAWELTTGYDGTVNSDDTEGDG
jgi:death-on-curing protein